MKQVQQHFANDENGNLVEIHSTHKGDGHVYYCPYCKQELTPKRGEHNEWHFAHKPDNQVKCSYDHYLHELAKRVIKEWYEREEHIYIQLVTDKRCKLYDACNLHVDELCIEKNVLTEPYDLKSFYPNCDLEQEFKANDAIFRADILLYNKHRLDIPPIALEIYVTHPCTEEKLSSGAKIIELRITTEEDIKRITSSCKLTPQNTIKFYGFHPTQIVDENRSIEIQRFYIVSYGRYVLEYVSCKECGEKKGLYQILHPSALFTAPPNREHCLFDAFKAGFFPKRCEFCIYAHSNMEQERLCALSKKFGTKYYCKDNDPEKCSFFRVAQYVI